MYTEFYGLREKPFSLSPDPRFLFLSDSHREALAHLLYGIEQGEGFIAITGEVGTGKTTLARYFLSRLDGSTHSAFVLYPALSGEELLKTILDELHVTPEGESRKSLVDALHRFLLETRAAGRNVVLIIDEAQDLAPDVLEQVRLISNLETDTEKLIQIVLMGQSELRDLLARHELRQLAQRVTARYHLSPLTLEETLAYIKHRLQVADGEGKVGFDHDALVAVHRLSAGVPRLVNLICDRSLIAGYVRNTRRITRSMVREAAREVEGDRPRGPLRWHHGLVAGGLTLLLAALAFSLLPRRAQAPDAAELTAAPAAGAATPLPPAPKPELARSARLDELVRTLPRDGSFVSAASRVQATWGRARLLRASLRSQLDQLRGFDLPAVLELAHPSRRDTCFAALLGLDERAARVAIGSEPELLVPVAQLDGLWTQEAIVWWPEESDASRDPARALAGLGFVEDDLTTAVTSFQQQASLVADGRLGPRTQMALYASSAQERPRLSRGARLP
jgi:general secretion pathway protein A